MTEYKELSHWADEVLQYEICDNLHQWFIRMDNLPHLGVKEEDITSIFILKIRPLILEFDRREEAKYKPNGN